MGRVPDTGVRDTGCMATDSTGLTVQQVTLRSRSSNANQLRSRSQQSPTEAGRLDSGQRSNSVGEGGGLAAPLRRRIGGASQVIIGRVMPDAPGTAKRTARIRIAAGRGRSSEPLLSFGSCLT